MLYHLLYPLRHYWVVFNVFKYITFRTIYAAVTAGGLTFFLGPWFIAQMRRLQMGQVIREEGPKSHYAKAGTPSMGGILMVAAITLSTLLWADLADLYVWIGLGVLLGFGAIGLYDDLAKILKRDSRGLPGRWKLLWQGVVVAGALYLLFTHGHFDPTLNLPFFKRVHPDLGPFYLVFAVLVVVGSSNAVNLTDGLDGLAIGPFIVAASVYTLFSYLAGHKGLATYLQIPYIPGVGELSIFCGAMVGAGLGFLWYNAYPAEIFMGDVGSLSLGGSLGIVSVMTKQELLLALVGGVFVAEALSVMLQVGYFKATGGKRIFRMAPLHHHFELKDIPEPKVIVRFWIVSILLGLIAVSTLKLR